MTDCKNCSYRIMLADLFDVHVFKEDCDKNGTNFCLKVNLPIVIPSAQTIKVRKPGNLDVHSYGEKKNG